MPRVWWSSGACRRFPGKYPAAMSLMRFTGRTLPLVGVLWFRNVTYSTARRLTSCLPYVSSSVVMRACLPSPTLFCGAIRRRYVKNCLAADVFLKIFALSLTFKIEGNTYAPRSPRSLGETVLRQAPKSYAIPCSCCCRAYSRDDRSSQPAGNAVARNQSTYR